MSNLYVASALLLALCAPGCLGDDVVYSCGGFVKSTVPISYEGIAVRLYTSEGNLKYESECAPNNGYYMLPVYTKGDYVLRIRPPKGWKFEPEKVEVRVDGATDACSLAEDIDFHFRGFPVDGRVLSGDGGRGPADFPVRLLRLDGGEPQLVAIAKTAVDGGYSFAGVMPGSYAIEGGAVATAGGADSLCAARLGAKVLVADAGVRVPDDLVISGYSLAGKIVDDGRPVGGVSVLLFAGEKRTMANCDAPLPAGLDLKSLTPPGLQHVCSALSSSATGKFAFHCVPPGAYTVLPAYKDSRSGVTFDIRPALAAIVVGSAPVEFTDAFRVAGYSVGGRVVASEKGAPIANARVTLKAAGSASSKLSTVTGASGQYGFTTVTSGKYELLVQADDVEFDARAVEIRPDSARLADIAPDRLQLCGRVSLENLPGGVKRLSQRRLTLTDAKTGDALSISTDEAGRFCRMTRRGEYNLQAQLLADERAAGVQLSPEVMKVVLDDGPVNDAVFSQVSVSLAGAVHCLADCRSARLQLSDAGDTEGRVLKEVPLPGGQAQQIVHFRIDDVLPADYYLRIVAEGVCWEADRLRVPVKDKDVAGLQFTQSGYGATVTLSHDAILNWSFASNAVVRGQANARAGANQLCLPAAGKYELTPSACHTFEPPSRSLVVGAAAAVEHVHFAAVRHAVALRVHTRELDDSLVVRLRVLSTGEETSMSGGRPAPGQAAGFVYRVEYNSRPGERLLFTPESAQFLFAPHELHASIDDACVQLEPIVGEKGVFFAGSITPPVQGVLVTMKHKTTENYELRAETDEGGAFRLGPVRRVADFAFAAHKDGYALEQSATKPGHFTAVKLSELRISVVDTEGRPLESALVSLSGGPDNYRSNNFTDPHSGSILFVGLTAGTYFVRPVLKEYAFEPAGLSVDVRQGAAESVALTGTRFAFSCLGRVRHLAGAPAAGAVVEAVSDACDQLHEQDTCDEHGAYRVRGLKPGCEYRLRVRPEAQAAAGTFPNFYTVQVSLADVAGYEFAVRPAVTHMDIMGRLHVHLNEHDDDDDGVVVQPTAEDERLLKQCRVSVYGERRPDTPLHTTQLHWPGRVFVLRQLPLDGRGYTVRLECAPTSAAGAGNAMALRQLYANLDSIAAEVPVRANETAKFVTVHFRPQRKAVEVEISKASYAALPVLLLLALLVYKRDSLSPALDLHVRTLLELVPAWLAAALPFAFGRPPSPAGRGRQQPPSDAQHGAGSSQHAGSGPDDFGPIAAELIQGEMRARRNRPRKT